MGGSADLGGVFDPTGADTVFQRQQPGLGCLDDLGGALRVPPDTVMEIGESTRSRSPPVRVVRSHRRPDLVVTTMENLWLLASDKPIKQPRPREEPMAVHALASQVMRAQRWIDLGVRRRILSPLTMRSVQYSPRGSGLRRLGLDDVLSGGPCPRGLNLPRQGCEQVRTSDAVPFGG